MQIIEQTFDEKFKLAQMEFNIKMGEIENNVEKHRAIARDCIFLPQEGNIEICMLCGMSKYLHNLK